MKSAHHIPILVTGAAGDLGAIGRHVTALLLAKGHKVRALVRREDERAEALRRLGVKVATSAVHRPGAPHADLAPRLCARRQQAGAQRRLGSRDALARNWRTG
jgi:nucleoside-diphosphate-sugar epimerase